LPRREQAHRNARCPRASLCALLRACARYRRSVDALGSRRTKGLPLHPVPGMSAAR